MNVNTETVRQLAFDISSASMNVEILILQILEKADSVASSTNVGTEAISAISCFGECVLRLIGVVSEQNDKLLQMTYGVPACVN